MNRSIGPIGTEIGVGIQAKQKQKQTGDYDGEDQSGRESGCESG